MGCKRLGTDFLFFLEVETSEELARTQKKDLNVYPFGLEHEGYNNVVNGIENNHLTYLGQEFQEELGLNWHSYKWRNAYPALGRFFGSDPIAEDYYYQTNYQFASNNPIWKVELEGLEGVKTNSGTDLNELGKMPKAMKNVSTDFVGPVLTVSGSLRGKYMGGEIGISLGRNVKAEFKGTIVEGRASASTDGNGVVYKVKGNILSGSASVAVPGYGKGEIGGSVVELGYEIDTQNINPNTDNPSQTGEGYGTFGTLYGFGNTSNGVSYTDGGSLFSSSDDKNLTMNGGKIQAGKVFTGSLTGNTVGISVGTGPAVISASADLDNAKKNTQNIAALLSNIIGSWLSSSITNNDTPD